ncbi:MAG: peptidylprolyl isomerase [Tissierellia bacterium]|nr:peptidylprolyl isomerase [Tissierellia bacterium]
MIEEKILARVEDLNITTDDVQAFINALQPEMQAQFNNQEGFNKIADELVNQELLYLDALDNKLDEEPIFVEQMNNMKINLLKQYAIAKVLNKVKIDDEELKKYYEEHKDYFKKPMEIEASHILVKTLEEAEEAIERLDQGESFEDLAKELSICPSKDAGGNLGVFHPGKMVKEFDEICQKIEIDKISEPVKTQFGYHVLVVKSRKEESYRSFEECKDEINKQVSALKQQEVYLEKTKELEKKYKVEKTY